MTNHIIIISAPNSGTIVIAVAVAIVVVGGGLTNHDDRLVLYLRVFRPKIPSEIISIASSKQQALSLSLSLSLSFEKEKK